MSMSTGTIPAPRRSAPASPSQQMKDLKLRVHRQLLERLDLVALASLDSSRVNAIVAPLAVRGPCLSIRRFGREPYRIDNLLAFGALTPEMVRYLAAVIQGRLNVIISGGTGAGKTTLLNCLTSFIPH